MDKHEINHVLSICANMTGNDGWVQRGKQTGDLAVRWQVADKLVKRGLLEQSPDGFAYRITSTGREYLGIVLIAKHIKTEEGYNHIFKAN